MLKNLLYYYLLLTYSSRKPCTFGNSTAGYFYTDDLKSKKINKPFPAKREASIVQTNQRLLLWNKKRNYVIFKLMISWRIWHYWTEINQNSNFSCYYFTDLSQILLLMSLKQTELNVKNIMYGSFSYSG